MKILIDPIYTGQVSRCASAVKMRVCVNYLLETTDDTFFYWLVPEKLEPEDKEWLPHSDRIAYLPIPYFEDRYKEYWHANDIYRRVVSFNGDYWDIDLVLSNRTTLVPFLRWALLKPASQIGWSKQVCLIEDMPIMSFKLFVPQTTERESDLSTLMGYLQAHQTCISAFWEKKKILAEARKYLAPSAVKYIADTMVEATHHQHSTPLLKSHDQVQKIANREKKFTISYAGRMVNRDAVDDSFDVILNHWIMGGEEVRIILCTVSKDFGRVKHDAAKIIEVMRPQREEFWRIMREDADVGVFMSRDEDYSMVMMEPLMQGTPLVLYRAEHAIASVGEDYPFFVNSTKDAYAMVRQFKMDYAEMYLKFAKWSQSSFAKLLHNRNAHYLPAFVANQVSKWHSLVDEKAENLTKNVVVKSIAEKAPDSFEVVEMVRYLEKQKYFRNNISWKAEEQFDDLRLVWSTHFDTYRLGLMKLGFKDAGPKAGWMKR